MIIDFHTHTFPEALAPRVLDKLSKSADIMYYVEGTVDALSASMAADGITHSVILPVATAPAQHETINKTAAAINDRAKATGIFSFGSVHPDNENYRQILRSLAEQGIRGIKLHPVYQGVYFDDIRYLRILDCACENGLLTVVHAGYDIGFPDIDYAAPEHILPVLKQVNPNGIILAHMGGWGCWDRVEELLLGYPVWLDTSFSLTPLRRPDPEHQGNRYCQQYGQDTSHCRPHEQDTSRCQQHEQDTSHCQQHEQDNNQVGENTASGLDNQTSTGFTLDRSQELSREQFCRIVRRLGAERILFGTDSPWTPQAETIQAVKTSGLTESELQKIFYKNAAQLLKLV